MKAENEKMIIVSNEQNQIVFSDKLTGINIHTSGLKLMATFEEASRPPVAIATYSTKDKCKKALELCVQAFERGEETFYMPNDYADYMNTNMVCGSLSRAYTSRTNGKTK